MHKRGLADTQFKARGLILAGEISVSGTIVTKAGTLVHGQESIALVHPGPRYVSRGGIKLAGALDHFGLDPTGWHCLDVGASTGGFTDCLLQRGAAHVFAIDVGRGQLDATLRLHPKVTWRESFHAKNLAPEMLHQPVDLVVVDVSFISLRRVLPFVFPCIKKAGTLLALIKPQFEASKKDVGKGVIRDAGKRERIVQAIVDFAKTELSLHHIRIAESILRGPKGNVEVFLCAENKAPAFDAQSSPK